MRQIRFPEIATFSAFLTLVFLLTILCTAIVQRILPAFELRVIAVSIAFLFFSYVFSIIAYRTVLRIWPLMDGEIGHGTREEFGYHLYLLFNLILFYPILRSGFVPVPLMRINYQLLGARLGANTYSSGIMFDPPLIRIGRDCIVGQSSLLIPHVIEGQRLAHYTIRIGDNVTIGAQAVVLAGVSIGDHAIVAIGAVVPKGTIIGVGEVWGGMPARKLSDRVLTNA